ncbi:Uncharacterized protein FKW44_009096 [Caligus rogercresseyi]|uniref:Uncharacterized protein n=1 Tax=Caligus rogercresseyi TaxID=217165 RepID=A0A7T8K6E3_CALRO|nr:Uncharacterized protein FKW44_009096 [Caligus rogercresseyi]
MEEKRIRVSALLDAQMDFRKIAELIPCSLGHVSKVKKLKDEGQDLGRNLVVTSSASLGCLQGDQGHQGQEASHFSWSIWPPSRPDCNPLDYGIWGVVERKACSIPHASVDVLKAAVEKEWAEMSVDFIVKTCKAFKPRIEAMLKANGGHFEL